MRILGMRTRWCAAALIALATGACAPSDDERCDDDMVLDDAVHACKAVGADADTGTADTGTEGATDASGTDVAADLGIGTPCASDADCAGLAADYCAFNPMDGTSGCVISQCDDPDIACPLGFSCCLLDPALGFPAMCIPEADMAELGDACAGGGQ